MMIKIILDQFVKLIKTNSPKLKKKIDAILMFHLTMHSNFKDYNQ